MDEPFATGITAIDAMKSALLEAFGERSPWDSVNAKSLGDIEEQMLDIALPNITFDRVHHIWARRTGRELTCGVRSSPKDVTRLMWNSDLGGD